jgi:hypothetical protein
LASWPEACKYPAVTMAIRRFAKQLETDKALANKVKLLKKMFYNKA